MNSRRIGCIVFAATFAFGASEARAQGFGITIDATALTDQPVQVPGQAVGTSNTPLAVTLDPGSYFFYGSRGFNSRFAFDVATTGVVAYDTSLDGFVSGRGTTTLVVDGVDITIDATALTPQANQLQSIAVFPQDTPTTFTLVPGNYFYYGGRGFNSRVNFQVSNAGVVEFDAALDNAVSGRGTATLVIDGVDITIDATALSPQTNQLQSIAVFPQATPTTFTLVPGDYFYYGGIGFNSRVNFQVTNAGEVDFDAALDNAVSGRGTATLVIDGVDITIDATALTPQANQLQSIAVFPQDTPTTFTLVPGNYFYYGGLGFNSRVNFDVTQAGEVDYDDNFENFLSGDLTATLSVEGVQFFIDARELADLGHTSYTLILGGGVFYPTATVGEFQLVPGVYPFDLPGPDRFSFTIDGDGHAASLPLSFLGIPVTGEGTNTMIFGDDLPIPVAPEISVTLEGIECGDEFVWARDRLLEFDVIATDTNDGDVVSIEATFDGGALPAAVSFSATDGNPATGSFSWTPETGDEGEHTLEFTATDNAGLQDTCFFTVDVTFDRDGDKLPDVWELDGYTATNGEFVDLPAMGANVEHKDVFVKIDYMQNAESDQKPADLTPIIVAFGNAPVDNVDGTTGITMHILVSDTPVPFVLMLGTGTTGASYRWAREDGEPETFFDDIKGASFAGELARAFRYCVFAHQISNLPDSGIARGIPTSDFIVSLGTFLDPSDPAPRKPPIDLQRGTFMHELGHGFGLRHGGADQTNFKPNYLSVMNYSFQSGLKKNGSPVFDFSRQALPDILETALNEELGIEDWPASLAGFQTTWFRGFGNSASQQWTSPFVAGVDHNVDWDQDGTDDEISVSASINKDFSRGLFMSHDDWDAIDFGGGVIGGGTAVPLPETTEILNELDLETAESFTPPPVGGLAGRSGRGSVRINWNPAGFRGDVTYSIFRKVAGTPGDPALLATTTSTLYSDRTVARGTTYEYTITFVDALDAESPASDPVTVRVR